MFWAENTIELLVDRGIMRPSGTVSVMSRILKKSAGKMNMSCRALAGTHMSVSFTVSGCLASCFAYAPKHVGHSTDREIAWNDASSLMHAPPWYSPRAERVMFLYVRMLSDPPMMCVG